MICIQSDTQFAVRHMHDCILEIHDVQRRVEKCKTLKKECATMLHDRIPEIHDCTERGR